MQSLMVEVLFRDEKALDVIRGLKDLGRSGQVLIGWPDGGWPASAGETASTGASAPVLELPKAPPNGQVMGAAPVAPATEAALQRDLIERVKKGSAAARPAPRPKRETAAEREGLKPGPDGMLQCRRCAQKLSIRGFGAHLRAHERDAAGIKPKNPYGAAARNRLGPRAGRDFSRLAGAPEKSLADEEETG